MTNAKFSILIGPDSQFGHSFTNQLKVVDEPLYLRYLIKCQLNMHLVLEDADHYVQHIECHHCHWKGTSTELERGDYFPLGDFTEVFCPSCNKYLGFIQHSSSHGETQ